MKKVSVILTFAGLAMFCVGELAAQSGGAGGAGASGAGASGAGVGGGGIGGGVPAPSAGAGATGGGALGASSPSQIPSQSLSPVPGGAVPRSPTMGGSLQAQPGAPLQTQPGTSLQAQPGASIQTPPGTGVQGMPFPNAVQNPLRTQGSGGNVEAGQNSQNPNGFGAGSAAQQNLQRANPNDPRLVRFNNEWWYWMPGDYWSYYRNNNWSRYDPYAYQPLTSGTRYQTGYRGSSGPIYYLDENGLRYTRSYAPDMPRSQALQALRQQGNTQTTTDNTQATIGGAVRGQQGPSVGAEIGGAVPNQ
jgi:hypothetical protein